MITTIETNFASMNVERQARVLRDPQVIEMVIIVSRMQALQVLARVSIVIDSFTLVTSKTKAKTFGQVGHTKVKRRSARDIHVFIFSPLVTIVKFKRNFGAS